MIQLLCKALANFISFIEILNIERERKKSFDENKNVFSIEENIFMNVWRILKGDVSFLKI